MTFFEMVQQFQQMQQYLSANLPQLDDRALALFYEQSRRFSRLSDDIRDEMRMRYSTHGSVAGWRLVRHQGARMLGNPDLAYDALKEVLTRQEFFSCGSISIPKLQGLYTQRRCELTPAMNEGMSTREFLDIITPLLVQKPDTLVWKKEGAGTFGRYA